VQREVHAQKSEKHVGIRQFGCNPLDNRAEIAIGAAPSGVPKLSSGVRPKLEHRVAEL
jgi:hypothetical protein